MKPSQVKRLEALEETAGLSPKTHFVWCNDEDGDIRDAVTEMAASGRARPGDRFVAIGWSSDPECRFRTKPPVVPG
jgi:hypothetical protein